jgi:hypothetical protein
MLIENEGNGRFGAVFRGRSGTNPRAPRRRCKQPLRIPGTAVASRRTNSHSEPPETDVPRKKTSKRAFLRLST